MEATTLGAPSNLTTELFGGRELVYFQGAHPAFAELEVEIDIVARSLIGFGIRPGEKISLWMTDRSERVHSSPRARKQAL